MNDILDDSSYPVEERLEMAKELLKMKETQLAQLQHKYDQSKSDRSWEQDQNSIHRMGL